MRYLHLFVLVAAGCGRNELTGENKFPAVEVDESDPPTSMGQWLSMGRSPDGSQLTMSYYDMDRSGLGFAVGTPLGDGTVRWAHEPVDGYPESNGLDTGKRGKYSSQATGPDGTVWVAEWDEGTSSLRVAHRLAPRTWEVQDVDPGAGRWTSLAIGADGNPFVVHCDDDGNVRRSDYDGSAWSSKTLFTSVDGEFPHGVAYTAALVAGGKEYVAFSDLATGALHLMTDGQDELVVGTGGATWPSIQVDGDTVYVAYQDATEEDLKIATKVGGGEWDRQKIDDGKLRGADTAMYLDGGEPVVVYFDGFDNDQRVARRSGGAWSHDKLAGDGVAAGYHNEVVQAGGFWWAGSYDYTNDTLVLTRL